jgi:hypothetical protein
LEQVEEAEEDYLVFPQDLTQVELLVLEQLTVAEAVEEQQAQDLEHKQEKLVEQV